jgi:putative endonuclease
MKIYYTYLLASRRNGTLYCGVTNNLIRRVWEHRNKPIGFAAKYKVEMLVWFAEHHDVREAIQQETRIKSWRRKWKLALIEKTNPQWRDLYDGLLPGAERHYEYDPTLIPNNGVIPETPQALSGTQEPQART